MSIYQRIIIIPLNVARNLQGIKRTEADKQTLTTGQYNEEIDVVQGVAFRS